MDGRADGTVKRHGAIRITDIVVEELRLKFKECNNGSGLGNQETTNKKTVLLAHLYNFG